MTGDALPAADGTLSIRNSAGNCPDRVLILAADPDKLRIPIGHYGEKEEADNIKKVFEW